MRVNKPESTRPLPEILADLVTWFKRQEPLGLTQTSIANGCYISQSQVSRVLDGRVKRQTKAVVALCTYASIRIKTDYDPTQDEALMDALRATIASPNQARQVERVIRALGVYS